MCQQRFAGAGCGPQKDGISQPQKATFLRRRFVPTELNDSQNPDNRSKLKQARVSMAFPPQNDHIEGALEGGVPGYSLHLVLGSHR